ncbi:MAG: hypothetical protein M3312_05765 [Actinomycetota bacterium]|nr:hypothetical protein [Actinomycetota bacterium]
MLWRRPLLEEYDGGRPLGDVLARILLSRPLRIALATASFLLALVVATALVGMKAAAANLAPTCVWVVFWLGLVPVVVLFGDVWPAINPWKAAPPNTIW